MTWGTRRHLLKDTKGLTYLDALVRSPCREIHVLELIGGQDDGGRRSHIG
jgi:hypothetical protein